MLDPPPSLMKPIPREDTLREERAIENIDFFPLRHELNQFTGI